MLKEIDMNRRGRGAIPNSSLINIFLNENVTLKSDKMTFLYRKLNTRVILKKPIQKHGIVYTSSPEIQRGKVLKVCQLNDLFNLFTGYDFEENAGEDEQNNFMQSSY